MLTDSIRTITQKYIYGIIVNGTIDHIHILVGFPPTIAISDLVRDIKRSSSLFINERKKSYLKFNWQEGFGAFTVGYRELDKIYNYILKQQEHHLKKSFKDEYNVDWHNLILYQYYSCQSYYFSQVRS